jgi:hypothetical protein
MSRILLLILVAISISIEFGCTEKKMQTEKKTQTIEMGEVGVFVINGCEYITWNGYKCGGIVHKQNCKFCIKRNKK